MKHTLPKSEILRSKKIIQELFSPSSSSFYLYPFQIRCIRATLPLDDKSFPEVLFVVSKKHFRKAHQRNLLRRRIKEAYRTQKHSLSDILQATRYMALVYIGKETLEYAQIEGKLLKVIRNINYSG